MATVPIPQPRRPIMENNDWTQEDNDFPLFGDDLKFVQREELYPRRVGTTGKKV